MARTKSCYIGSGQLDLPFESRVYIHDTIQGSDPNIDEQLEIAKVDDKDIEYLKELRKQTQLFTNIDEYNVANAVKDMIDKDSLVTYKIMTFYRQQANIVGLDFYSYPEFYKGKELWRCSTKKPYMRNQLIKSSFESLKSLEDEIFKHVMPDNGVLANLPSSKRLKNAIERYKNSLTKHDFSEESKIGGEIIGLIRNILRDDSKSTKHLYTLSSLFLNHGTYSISYSESEKRLKIKPLIKEGVNITEEFFKNLYGSEEVDDLLSEDITQFELNLDGLTELKLEDVIDLNERLNQNDTIASQMSDIIFNTAKQLGIKYVADPLLSSSGRSRETVVFFNPYHISPRTIMHETIHAITTYYLNANSKTQATFSKDIKEAIDVLKNAHQIMLEEYLKTLSPKELEIYKKDPNGTEWKMFLFNNHKYYLLNAKEFTAELSDEQLIKDIEEFDARAEKDESLLQRIIKAIFTLIKKGTKGRVKTSVEEAFSRLVTTPNPEIHGRSATINVSSISAQTNKPTIDPLSYLKTYLKDITTNNDLLSNYDIPIDTTFLEAVDPNKLDSFTDLNSLLDYISEKSTNQDLSSDSNDFKEEKAYFRNELNNNLRIIMESATRYVIDYGYSYSRDYFIYKNFINTNKDSQAYEAIKTVFNEKAKEESNKVKNKTIAEQKLDKIDKKEQKEKEKKNINSNKIQQQLTQNNTEIPEPLTSPLPKSFTVKNGTINIEVDDDKKAIVEDIKHYTYDLRNPIGEKLQLDPKQFAIPQDLVKAIKIMNSQVSNYIYNYYDGTETFEALSKEWQEVLKENGIEFIPKYIFGRTIDESIVMDQENTLINSNMIKMSELRDWSRSAVAQLSYNLSLLKTSPAANEQFFGDDFKNENFIGNSTEEILEKVGVERVLTELMKEPIFNIYKNSAADEDFDVSDKMELVYNNFRGFLNLCYDQLFAIEGIVLQSKRDAVYYDPVQETQGDSQDVVVQDEATLAEEHGSSLQHWQVGFRSVSPHNTLSKEVRSRLANMLDLNKDGTPKKNELGLNKFIDVHNVVNQILLFTQNSESLNNKNEKGEYESTSMIAKLQKYAKRHPWINQLVGTYYPNGDTSQQQVAGILVSNEPVDESIKSMFYNNFQKYFQKYNVMYYQSGKGMIFKTLNTSSFTQDTLDTLQDKINTKEQGGLSLYDSIAGTWKVNEVKALMQQISQVLRYVQTVSATGLIWGSSSSSLLEQAYKMLDIPLPSSDEFDGLLKQANKSELQSLLQAASYSLKAVVDGANNSDFDLYKSISNNVKILSEFISPLMTTELQSVFYQDGKSYYSYVLPSYLNKYITKLSGVTENYNKFLENEFGKYTGWFKDDNGKWLNYWLEVLDKDPSARKELEHSALLADNGVGYTDKTPSQYTSSIICNYFYSKSAKRFAWFRVPTLSNKPSEEYIKFVKITENFEDTISELLATNTFKQEVNRIKAVRARRKLAETTSNPQNKEKIEEQKKELLKKLSSGNLSIDERKELNQKIDMLTMDKDTAITNFDKNGDKFHFLKFLNDEIAKGTTLGKLVNKYIDGDLGITEINEGDTTYNSEIEYLNDLLKRSIKEDIMSSYNQFKEMLVENGTIVVDENGNYRTSDMKNLQSALQTRNGRSGEDLLREFYFNDIFAQTNIMQLTITDLAFYKNTEDLQKRLAQLHAPSMKPNINATINNERVSDGKFRTVYIKDAEVMSNAIENLEKARDKILANPRYAKDKIVYNQVKARLNDVINQFMKVNWADAQGYTSPTAYRKRMAMFGKWDQRQEDAYNQLKEGKVSVDNLDILWQPLKPFGYSQISVNGHNPFMPNIKMGIQNKNSEYLLIMADAILKGGKVNNKLSALYDIMEESYNRPNSKDKGIDAIQFESTVKVGKRSVIDINGATTAAEVKQIFNDRLYNDDQYNTEYVQEYNFEDYGIQQEVPAHFEGSQQHGSQVRILTISDISAKDANGNENYLSINGEMKKVSECRDNYLAAIERNINRSIDELKQRFNLNTYNSKMVNKAISDLLRDEILRDGRYGTDMLQAVSLNEKGEFNVPLSNPVHSDRIQQLLNSIIKNSIWKQKIAGGPVVQVSSYGLSEDLEIKWREDGTIEYFECYVPIPDENIYKDFVKEDGTIDIKKMEKTNPKLLDMFGYRIPTESKYSMVPIKVKGFLPRNAGEAIMLPKEITLLSGSDFDIDKLYIMRYEFDRHEVWSDEKLGDLKNSIYDTTGELYSKQQIKDHLTGKQIIENESVARLLSEAKPEVEYRNPKSGRAADNNIIIDYSLAFLTSSYALEQLTTPGNFDEPKRVGYLIQACKNSGRSYSELSNMTTEQLKEIAYKDQSLLHVQTQIAFHRQNMVAGQLIGAFAQGNVSHAFVSLWNDMGHKSGIDIRKSELIDETFKINGISFSGMVEIDPEYEIGQHESTRVSANLSAYLAASVDAVKDPILNLMNINMDTINIVIPLIRMGIDIETVGLLLSHPAVIDITNKGGLKNGGEGLVERINEYRKDYQQDSSFDINKEFLAGQLNKEYNPEVHDPDDLQVLFAVFNIMKLGNTFRSITSATRYNSISSAVGPFMSDTAVRRNAIENFANEKTNTKMSKDLREIIDAENGMPILKSIISNAYYIEDRIFGGFSGFSYIHDLRRQLKDMESSLGYMNPTVAKKFYDFYVSYAECIEGRNLFDMSDENRDYILNTFPEEFKEARSKHIDNKLVQAIKLKTDSNENVILSLPTRGYSTDQVEDFKNAWADLYEEDEELAKKLIEYNFFRGSFTFSPKTFMHLLPISIMQKLRSDTNNASYVGNVTRDLQEFVMDNAMDQFKVINGLADRYLKTEEELKSLIKYAFKISRNSDKSVHFIVKLGKDYLYVDQHGSKPIDNLGGNGQAFEIDPARPVYEIHSVLKNQQATSEEEGNNAKIRDNSEAEPIDIGEQRTILSRTTVQSLLGEEFDMLMTNGLSEADVASVFINKLSVKFERAEISKRSGLSYAVLDAIEDAIKQYTGNVITTDELNRIIQELNLC